MRSTAIVLAGSLAATLATVCLCAAPIAAAAQEAGARAAGPQTVTDASHGAARAETPPKRPISEEGGMKASGPSQGRNGESR